MSVSKVRNIALWVLQVLLALAFIAAGGGKLGGTAVMVQQFDTIGLGQWFRYLTGALETGSAVLLLIPGLAAFGALTLTCVMVGAIIAHLTVLHTPPAAPALLLVVAVLVLWGRWTQIAGRFRVRAESR